MQVCPNWQLADILDAPFEQRSTDDHHLLTNLLIRAVGCSIETAKLYSLLCRQLQPRDKEHEPETLQMGTLLLERGSEEAEFSCRQLENAEMVEVGEGKLRVVVGAADVGKVGEMGTLEEEMKFLQGCESMMDVARRRLYLLLRHCEAKRYSFGQYVYQQAQLDAPGIYIVRSGQFAFAKRDTTRKVRNIELVSFSQGYLFGTEEEQGPSEDLSRQFSVRCKSSTGLVYRIPEDFFNSFLRKTCEAHMRINKRKLMQFLEGKMAEIEKNRQTHAQWLGAPLQRSVSTMLVPLPAPMALVRQESVDYNKDMLATQRSTQLPLLKTGEVKAKRIFKVETGRVVVNPEYQEEQRIVTKKIKCEKLRELAKNSASALSRGEVLLRLMKTSWQFEKDRRKPALP